MNDNYDDIIDLPHHVSKTRRQMPMEKRAAQFAPFNPFGIKIEPETKEEKKDDDLIYYDDWRYCDEMLPEEMRKG